MISPSHSLELLDLVPLFWFIDLFSGVSGVKRGSLAHGSGRSIVPGATVASGIENDRVLAVNRSEEKPLIVIDNYDSYTYNLCQVFGSMRLGCLFLSFLFSKIQF